MKICAQSCTQVVHNRQVQWTKKTSRTQVTEMKHTAMCTSLWRVLRELRNIG